MFRGFGISLFIGSMMLAVGCGGSSAPRSKTASSAPTSSPSSGSNSSDAPISIYPAGDTLRIGGQRRFSGFDRRVGQFEVTWTVQEGAAGGSITPDGLYTAPSTIGTFHIVATSMATPEISASVPVTVLSVGFVPVENMSVPRSRHTATLLADGRVLVAGGTSDSAHSAQLFIPSSISFTATSGGMVHVRSGQCAALLQDGRVLIVGGDDGHGNLTTTAEVFDPATQTFFSTGNLNHARTAATCTLLPNGKVLIAGGQDSAGTLLPSAELYDAFAGTFTLTGSMQHARAQHTATLLSNGRVLLVGNSYDSTSAEVFDPAAGVFRATGSLSQPRAHETATLLPNGKVLVLGGSQVMVPVGGGAPAAPVSIGSAELYDPASGSFHLAGKLSMARDSHSATLLANGSVLVAGGYVHTFDGDAQPEWYSVFTAELINPVTLAAKPAASLESDRTEHVATLLKNGELLVTGGRSGYQELCCSPKPYIGPLNSAELYK